ncbi:MAG: GNAT family N-acetyltransferase [Acetobacter sp.]|nr:GNAT family N-acetyltransferase [Bacteroides sp.]MCM1341448.1 GNAT family N-acetyltransferase [Acetobacter sp.]MCM1433400.1 GNAT family N-acetyltransferase [Clostridiales bacterium]
MIELVLIKENELKMAYRMHRKGFIPTFLKYHDRNNPVFTTYKKFLSYFISPNMHMYWIIYNGEAVGEIFVYIKDDFVKLARIFILKKFQNKGIAQNAIKIAENLFTNNKRWCLNTIKEEKNNCHLYEKLGYKPTGKEKVINKRMTVIDYEKFIDIEEKKLEINGMSIGFCSISKEEWQCMNTK